MALQQNNQSLITRELLQLRWIRSVGSLSVALSGYASARGCATPLRQWVDNGFKVGPNYRIGPSALVESEWIDYGSDPRLLASEGNTASWWQVFNDPQLNQLMDHGLTTEPYPANSGYPYTASPSRSRHCRW